MATYKDIDLKFARHPVTNDVAVRTDVMAVLQSIREIVLTAPGEWDADRNFGAGVYRLLGENADPMALANMKGSIEDKIKQYEPRADLKRVVVTQNPNNLHMVTILVEFYTLNVPELQTVEIPLKRLR
ncbi:lysozyme [Vibrio phage 1.244.A._10N.261.54.C3]|nr:lysozyme [Vibrio phage 1.244.A._10N.261.54.C3]AUR98688.1 lysozyme [Vibrio phage 1.255.O._10N.286.45.F1]